MTTPFNRHADQYPPEITWTGEDTDAPKLDSFCRNSSLLTRWMYDRFLHDKPRVLIEPEEGELTSAEWVEIEPGTVLYRLNPRDLDSPLRIKES